MPNIELVTNFLIYVKNYFKWSNIQCSLAIWTGFLISSHLVNGFNLQLINKYDGCLINNNIFYDKATLEQRKKDVDKAKIRALLPYVNKLVKNVDEDLLKNMYRNLKTVNVHQNPLTMLLFLFGSYNIPKNKIQYAIPSTIGHELLHLSSSYYDKKTKETHIGFSQSKGYACIGSGLNEAYTELLASRFFNKSGKPRFYRGLVRIAKLMEFFFDDPSDMQKYFFMHNLPGYIKYMEQFIPRKVFVHMLLELDSMQTLLMVDFVVPTFKGVNLELDLYKYFLKTNPSREKRRAFESIIKETKIGEMALNRNKMKLNRRSVPVRRNNDAGLEIYHNRRAM